MNNVSSPVAARPSLLRLLLRGACAGFVAGLVMLLVMVILRSTIGAPTPIEMIFDRLFPLLTVKFFIGSLVRAGGYTPLKLQGLYGALAGQAARSPRSAGWSTPGSSDASRNRRIPGILLLPPNGLIRTAGG